MEVIMTHVERFSWLYMGLECDDLFRTSRSTRKRLWGWSVCHMETTEKKRLFFFHLRDLLQCDPFLFFARLIWAAGYLFSVGVPKLALCDPCVRRVMQPQCDAASQANSGARLFIGEVERNGKQKLDDRCTHVKNQVWTLALRILVLAEFSATFSLRSTFSDCCSTNLPQEREFTRVHVCLFLVKTTFFSN